MVVEGEDLGRCLDQPAILSERAAAKPAHQISVSLDNAPGGLLERLGIDRAHPPLQRLQPLDEVDHFGHFLGWEGLDLVNDFDCGHEQEPTGWWFSGNGDVEFMMWDPR